MDISGLKMKICTIILYNNTCTFSPPLSVRIRSGIPYNCRLLRNSSVLYYFCCYCYTVKILLNESTHQLPHVSQFSTYPIITLTLHHVNKLGSLWCPSNKVWIRNSICSTWYWCRPPQIHWINLLQWMQNPWDGEIYTTGLQNSSCHVVANIWHVLFYLTDYLLIANISKCWVIFHQTILRPNIEQRSSTYTEHRCYFSPCESKLSQEYYFVLFNVDVWSAHMTRTNPFSMVLVTIIM